jgi:hypothetical protein
MSLPAKHTRLVKAVACLLNDERLRGRFYSLKSLRTLINETTPDGRFVRWHTLLTTFSRSNDLDWYFEHALEGEVDFVKGTFLAIRRVERKGGKKGKYTAIGCFGPNSTIPGAKSIKALAENDPGLRISPRSEGFSLPPAIKKNYHDYALTDFFSSDKRDANTPIKRQRPDSARPDSAGSGREALEKRGRQDYSLQIKEEFIPMLPPKSKKEQIAELRESIAVHLKEQRKLEETIATKVKALRLQPIMLQIERSNAIDKTIHKLLTELNDLQSKRVDIDDFTTDDDPRRLEMHYTLGGGEKAGIKDLFLDRGIILTSELIEDGIVHQSAAAVEEDAQEENNSQPDADTNAITKKPSRRSKNKSYRARNRRARFVLDKKHDCWIPKWLVLVGSAQYAQDQALADGAKRLKGR